MPWPCDSILQNKLVFQLRDSPDAGQLSQTVMGGLRLWPQSSATLTLLKSSAVALISFQVLFNSWMQIPKSSSKARSWVKNMGW